MLLSNYTFSVNLSHVLLFEQFLTATLKPELEKNPLISFVKSFKLLTETQNDGLTVSLQLYFPSAEEYMAFELNHQHRLFDMLDKRFSGHYHYFQSLLEEI